jgi:hypothetical protein
MLDHTPLPGTCTSYRKTSVAMHFIEWTPNREARAIVGNCARSMGKSGGLSKGSDAYMHASAYIVVTLA